MQRARLIRSLVPAALSVCAVLAGCGDSGPDAATDSGATPETTAALTGAAAGPEADVRAVIERELTALAEGNGAKACELMTPRGEEEATAIVNQVAVERQIDLSFDDCTKAIYASLGGSEPDPAALERAKTLASSAEVNVEENQATALIGRSEGPDPATLSFERADGEWLIVDPSVLVEAALAATQ